jgi:predicted AlkP superfamily phosphohydrolase/phosphomutase
MTSRVPPLVIVQCDAFDPALTRQWMDEGHLPALAALRDRGVVSSIGGPEHIAELGLALSAFSGVSRSRHAYYDYRQLRPGTYDLYPAAPTDASARPFWSALKGRRVVTLDAGESTPVEGLDGAQLTNWTAHQSATRIEPPMGVPPTVVADARRTFGDHSRVSEFLVDSKPSDDRPVLAALADRVRRKGELCRAMARDGADVLVVGFYEAHTAGHRFWKYQQGRASDPELRVAMRTVYAAIDREIGLLMERFPDANVAVLSFFGMRDEYPSEGLMEGFCRVLGYQAAPVASPDQRRSFRSPMDIARALMPQALREAISRRLPNHVQEELLARAFRSGTDWRRTVAFNIPSLYTGHIRVNVRGREPQGIVEPGKEYRDVLDRVEADLRELEDPLTSAPVVRAIHRTERLFNESPPPHLPDLFVEWEPTPVFRAQVVHPRGVLRQVPPAYFRDSYHSLEGLAILGGPSVRPTRDPVATDLLDLAPTFLTWLGASVPSEMTGSPSPALGHAGRS